MGQTIVTITETTGLFTGAAVLGTDVCALAKSVAGLHVRAGKNFDLDQCPTEQLMVVPFLNSAMSAISEIAKATNDDWDEVARARVIAAIKELRKDGHHLLSQLGHKEEG